MLTVRIVRKDGSEDRRNYQGTLESCKGPVETLVNTHVTQDPDCRIVAFDDQIPQAGETVLHAGFEAPVAVAPEPEAKPAKAEKVEPAKPTLVDRLKKRR